MSAANGRRRAGASGTRPPAGRGSTKAKPRKSRLQRCIDQMVFDGLIEAVRDLEGRTRYRIFGSDVPTRVVPAGEE